MSYTNFSKAKLNYAVVLAQLVDWLLPKPEVSNLNPLIRKNYIERLLPAVLKDKKKQKRGWELTI